MRLRGIRLAWRRATLLPVRLAILVLSLALVFSIVLWSGKETQTVLQRQQLSTQFMGLRGWTIHREVTTPTVTGNNPLAELYPAPPKIPAIFFVKGTFTGREPNAVEASLVRIAFANAESWPEQPAEYSGVSCVWMGGASPAALELLIAKTLRCHLVSPPQGWRALAAELNVDTVIVPVRDAGLVAGANWHQGIEFIILGANSPCAGMFASFQEGVNCALIAATRSSASLASSRMQKTQTWILPSALLVALLSILNYMKGIRPLFLKEYALRTATGALPRRLNLWLLGATAWQLLLVIGALIVPAGTAYVALGVVPSARELQAFGLFVTMVIGSASVTVLVGIRWQRDAGVAALGKGF